MALTLILCTTIFGSFVFIGFHIWRGYKIRRDFFADLVKFCDHLTTEINFSKNTVEQVIRRYIDTYNMQFAEVLLKYSHLLARNADITRESLKEFIVRDDVADFFFELGKHSAHEECEKIKSARLRFENLYQNAKDKLSHEASIYFKISIILGVGVVILIL